MSDMTEKLRESLVTATIDGTCQHPGCHARSKLVIVASESDSARVAIAFVCRVHAQWMHDHIRENAQADGMNILVDRPPE